MRTWSVDNREDLSQWLRSHGFAATQPGNHIPARVQEALSQEVCRIDARVVLLEAMFVQLVLHFGRYTVVSRGAEPGTNQSAPATRTMVESSRWAQMDDVDSTECMLRRIPMLKTCP